MGSLRHSHISQTNILRAHTKGSTLENLSLCGAVCVHAVEVATNFPACKCDGRASFGLHLRCFLFCFVFKGSMTDHYEV